MKDDLDQPPRAYTTADVASQPEPKPGMGWRRKVTLWFVTVVLVVMLGFAAYTWSALHFNYSQGDRAGFVDAPLDVPAGLEIVERSRGGGGRTRRRHVEDPVAVDITYQQHTGVPTSCFGETEYFVTAVRAAPQ